MKDDDLVASVKEMAEMLKISERFAYDLIKRGAVPSVRIGRRILVPIEAIRTLVTRAIAAGGVDKLDGSYTQVRMD